MTTDFMIPLTRSLDVISTASKVTKVVNIVKTMVYAVAASLVLLNVISLVRQSI